MNSVRFVFIVGFEKCMTTSLATYLLAAYDCDLLVRGIKEPWIFTNDRTAASRIIEHRVTSNPGTRIFLDASVSYVSSPAALKAIAASGLDYRIVVCLRNQFKRTVSAYRYYRTLMTIPLAAADQESVVPEVLADLERAPRLAHSVVRTMARSYCRAFGMPPTEFLGEDLGAWMAKSGAGAPAHFLAPPAGRYFGTSVMVAALGSDQLTPAAVMESDRECELIGSQDLPARITHEIRHLKTRGTLPRLNILGNSFFAPILENLLETVDPTRVLMLSMESVAGSPALAVTLADFLGCAASTRGVVFPKSNDTGRQASLVHDTQLRRAELLVRDGLIPDTEAIMRTLSRHSAMDLSLFNAEMLYH